VSEISVTVRVGVGDGALVIPDDCPVEGGIMWTSLGNPEWSLRLATAPPSLYVPGNVLLSAVEDSGEVPMTVLVRGSSLGDLEARKAAVRAALSAWPGGTMQFLATDLGIEGSPPVSIGGPWGTFPTVPRWGAVEVNLLRYYSVEGVIAVPVNPEGAP
jgi:hypothetical protein